MTIHQLLPLSNYKYRSTESNQSLERIDMHMQAILQNSLFMCVAVSCSLNFGTPRYGIALRSHLHELIQREITQKIRI